MRRVVFTYVALGLGALMIVAGVASFLTPSPHPEVATAGVTLILATGLVGANGNGNGNGRRR